MQVYTDVFRICGNKLLRSHKILAIFILLCVIIVLLLVIIVQLYQCDCNSTNIAEVLSSESLVKQRNHVLCLIIPFRDRFDELLVFLTHMKVFLDKQNVKHHVYVVNQVDSYRFNRGSLINVGFLYISTHSPQCDFIAMHDVDLIPLNPQLNYSYPGDSIMHIAAPHLHPKYHYKTFIGGILMMKNTHFKLVNGLSNKYWGWGLEDDELYVRIKEARIRIERPPENLGTGITDTFKHIHDKTRRRRDMTKCFNQKEVTRKRDRETGLHDVQYERISSYVMSVNGSNAVILNVGLKCNRTVTPWCLCRPVGVKPVPPVPRVGEPNT
uniref:Beta-1,4-N-acetylgalactosaminyltransferase n=1 Tax=Cacopsylla melanoneura TaxID=428564 RepID=A0A8D9AG00_9HEMI